MSYPHMPALGGARAVSSSASTVARAPTRPELRALRPAIRTRRYEIAYLAVDGTVETTSRLAPATPEFEEAFSAFARGTLIHTTEGPVAIEDLVPGMTAVTAGGRAETVVWIGSMTAYPAHTIPGVEPLVMTRVTAEAFGVGRPMPDLLVGPRARLLLADARARAATGAEAAFVPLRGFIDQETVIEVNPAAPISVFHLALRRHAAVRAGGLELEAYHPGPACAAMRDPQMAGLFVSLFPHIGEMSEFGPMAHPRLSERDFSLVSAA